MHYVLLVSYAVDISCEIKHFLAEPPLVIVPSDKFYKIIVKTDSGVGIVSFEISTFVLLATSRMRLVCKLNAVR